MLASRRRLPTVAHDCNDIECEDYRGSQNICQWLQREEQKQAMRAAGSAEERLEQRWIIVFNGGSEMTQMEEHLANLVFAAAPGAVADCKALVRDVSGVFIDRELSQDTSKRIAARRVSDEGKEGIAAFLEKRPPSWGK